MCRGTLTCTFSDMHVPKGKVSCMGGGGEESCACRCVRVRVCVCEHHKHVSADSPPHPAGNGALGHPQVPATTRGF